MDLAEVAKKDNHLHSARKFYRQAVQIQPYASCAWIEYAKLEEECGELNKSQVCLKSFKL